MVFNPSMIRNGKDYYEEIHFPELEETYGDGQVRIRGLTSKEWDEVKALEVDVGILTKTQEGEDGPETSKLEIDPGLLHEKETKARRTAVAYGLSVKGQEWTEEKVGNLRPPWIVEDIYRHVIRLTGVTKEVQEELKEFPEDTGE